MVYALGLTKITAQRDIENETLGLKEFVDAAATGWPVSYGCSKARCVDAAGICREYTGDLRTLQQSLKHSALRIAHNLVKHLPRKTRYYTRSKVRG